MPVSEPAISVPAPRQNAFDRWLQPFSFPVFLGMLLVCAAFVLARSSVPALAVRFDPDTWWHLKIGQDILSSGHWPVADYYSFSAHGRSWIEYEWLGDVLLALAAKTGGLRGLIVLLAILGSAVLLPMYAYAWMRSGNPKAAFIACAILLPLVSDCYTLRPQLLGYTFLVIVLICLERFRRGRTGALWFLPPVFLLWVNTHGSFTLGLLAVGIYWLCGWKDFTWGGIRGARLPSGARHRLELATVASILVLPLTPYGAQLAFSPIEYAFSLPVNMANIQEWQPINFRAWEPKLLLLLFLGFLVAQILLRLEYRIEEIALLILAAYSTMVHYRFVLFFAIVFVPLLASLIARAVPAYEPRKDPRAANLALIAFALVAMFFAVPARADLQRRVARDYPVQALAFMAAHPAGGPMFNAYGYGGFLVWARGPQQRVFIDGRGDLYERAGVFSDYVHIMDVEPDTLSLLAKYGVASCLIPRDAPLGTLLFAQQNWKRVYADSLAAIYVRQPAFSPAQRTNAQNRAARGVPKAAG